MTAKACGLPCCSSALMPKSKLLHNSEVHHGFILKLSHPIGKNTGFSQSLKNRIIHLAPVCSKPEKTVF